MAKSTLRSRITSKGRLKLEGGAGEGGREGEGEWEGGGKEGGRGGGRKEEEGRGRGGRKEREEGVCTQSMLKKEAVHIQRRHLSWPNGILSPENKLFRGSRRLSRSFLFSASATISAALPFGHLMIGTVPEGTGGGGGRVNCRRVGREGGTPTSSGKHRKEGFNHSVTDSLYVSVSCVRPVQGCEGGGTGHYYKE